MQRYAWQVMPITWMVKQKERREDALALRADERRDKLRKMWAILFWRRKGTSEEDKALDNIQENKKNW